MKFKIGNRTKLIDKKSTCLSGFSIGDEIEIMEIDNNDDDLKYRIKNTSNHLSGWAKESDLQPLEIEIGDTVKINKQATIEDFTKNHWNGCQIDTLGFIKEHGDKDEEFIVTKITKNHLFILESEKYINRNIFELVKKKENIKEMTVSEIEEALGITGLRIKKED